jgi:hypothetical protein
MEPSLRRVGKSPRQKWIVAPYSGMISSLIIIIEEKNTKLEVRENLKTLVFCDTRSLNLQNLSRGGIRQWNKR